MIVLGIESSCDETAIAIIKSEQEKSVLKNIDICRIRTYASEREVISSHTP